MGFDINKIRAEFDKEKKDLEAKNKAVFDAMKTCADCHETETKFIPCVKHLGELKAVGEAMGNLQMNTQLKVQMHPEEMQKIMDAQRKAMIEAMQKQGKKPKGCSDKSCSDCR
jgi:hypothetical protein